MIVLATLALIVLYVGLHAIVPDVLRHDFLFEGVFSVAQLLRDSCSGSS